jgi:hypothetical protein
MEQGAIEVPEATTSAKPNAKAQGTGISLDVCANASYISLIASVS